MTYGTVISKGFLVFLGELASKLNLSNLQNLTRAGYPLVARRTLLVQGRET